MDHWVPNWAEGYNLPYYYSHIPQIVIVGTYRFMQQVSCNMFHVTCHVSLFQYYHIVIYLLLCFVPVPIFLALRVIGLPWLTAGFGALLATHLSTDGLYGLDPSSFLWRGYGLSSQLFAMIWLPLALAYSYRYFACDMKHVTRDTKNIFHRIYLSLVTCHLLPAVFFTTATVAGHLGIGMIAMLSLGFLAASKPLSMILRQEPLRDTLQIAKEQFIRLCLVAGLAIFLLSYWIVPTLIHGNYHNFSFWDPTWKFDSYGWKETMIRLFNGDLFDFGRFPVITILIFMGIFAALKEKLESRSLKLDQASSVHHQDPASSLQRPLSLFPFAFLFIFWLLFYFGRTTWGGLIDIIPGMKDFHLSRFLVGLHVTGMLLAPIGFTFLVSRITYHVSRFIKYSFIGLFVYLIIGLLLLPPIYKWTMTYNELNDRLIVQANKNHAAVKNDEQLLFTKLRSYEATRPGRIFAGRGGGFGKNFRVAETQYFMHLSTYGLPTTLWLPETWSMNSDTEQYFSEDQAKDYDLYNMRWVAAPPDQAAQPFWKLIDQAPTWKLYEVPTSGYFTVGIRPATVSITKFNFVNVVHLWIQSTAHANGLFPELTFDTNYPKPTGLANFKMTDEATYLTPDNLSAQAGKTHSLMAEPPVYLPPGVASKEQFDALVAKQASSAGSFVNATLLGPEKDDTDMTFSTKVEVGNNCVECMVILKQTYHPNWKATVDGKAVKPIIVFPFYIGIPVSAGTHEIVVWYGPSALKVALLVLSLVALVAFVAPLLPRFLQKKR